MAERPLRVGVVGIGVGAAEVVRSMEASSYIDLYAGADVDPDVRQRFQEAFPDAKVYDSVEKLVADPEVEAVWVSTPNRFHASHTITAANAGKHVVVEKPMAISLKEAEEMVAAADRNNVKLLAGHTQSFSPPVRLMRQIVRSGELGKLCAINVFAYTDWLLRPRTADELDPKQGGGIVYRQVPHQIDSIRLIGGGRLRSVRGTFGQWMPERPIPGYYVAYMEFEDGTPAVAIHNAYGHFLAAELVPWGSSEQQYKAAERVKIRKALRNGTRNETADKLEMRIGGSADVGRTRTGGGPWMPNDLGIMIVSCERGEIRQSPEGLYVYNDDGMREIKLPRGASREAELRELYNTVVLDGKVFHGGRWGMATLEVALGIMESAETHHDVALTHQMEMDPDYDVEYAVKVEEETVLV